MFERFSHWVSTQEMIFNEGPDRWKPADSDLLLLSKLWTLGDYLLAESFQNCVMKLIYFVLLGPNDEKHLRDMLNHAYQADIGTMVKEILVHKFCWKLELKELAEWLIQDLPAGFTDHLVCEMKAVHEGRKSLEKWGFEKVSYYLINN